MESRNKIFSLNMPGTGSVSVSGPVPPMPMSKGSQQLSPDDPIEFCTTSELPTLLQECSSHCIKLIAGIDAPTLRDLIETISGVADELPIRPIVFLDSHGLDRTEAVIDHAIGQLAGVASDLWPLWFGAEDFCELNNDALGHMYLPIKLANILSRSPEISSGWAEAAIKQVLRTRPPRVPGAPAEMEWSQLCRAISPKGLIGVVTLEEMAPHLTWPFVHALEWLAANGNVAIVVLCRNLPPREAPFDHLLFGARVLTLSPNPANSPETWEGEARPDFESKLPSAELILSMDDHIRSAR